MKKTKNKISNIKYALLTLLVSTVLIVISLVVHVVING